MTLGRTERIIAKAKKEKTWSKVGGFDSVLFVPKTPEGKLKRMCEQDIRKSGIDSGKDRSDSEESTSNFEPIQITMLRQG